MRAYYNEFDKKKCAALKQLMADGYITKGEIDDRSIAEVLPEDLKGFDRCHFFAGIGLWDHALNLARWEEGRRVWTGSCPCQPYSSAGRQKGKADDRHLWPEWLRLIEECRPPTVFGEQVASAVSFGWLDDVYQGLEAQGYAVGSAVLPACSVGAPHKRDRLWFVGHSKYDGSSTNAELRGDEANGNKRWAQGQDISGQPSGASAADNVRGIQGSDDRKREDSGAMGNAGGEGSQGHGRPEQELCEERREIEERYPWQTGVWIDCPDGKQRLVEPGISLLVDGYPERVGLIHCAGDAIVPQVAANFIRSFIEAT